MISEFDMIWAKAENERQKKTKLSLNWEYGLFRQLHLTTELLYTFLCNFRRAF